MRKYSIIHFSDNSCAYRDMCKICNRHWQNAPENCSSICSEVTTFHMYFYRFIGLTKNMVAYIWTSRYNAMCFVHILICFVYFLHAFPLTSCLNGDRERSIRTNTHRAPPITAIRNDNSLLFTIVKIFIKFL
jgi:hypothetical protein